jgi:four helix bundle protein
VASGWDCGGDEQIQLTEDGRRKTKEDKVPFKFEKLEVWQLSLDYIDLIYGIANQLPRSEDFNLKSQMVRAATSVALNIAEGSTGQTDSEQARFLGLAIRSLIETIACQRIIGRRRLLKDECGLQEANDGAQPLAAKLHTMRRVIAPDQSWLREVPEVYSTDENQIAD